MSGIGSHSAPTYGGAAPVGYVAGVGRGALGFTTRSDIGPARAAVAVLPSGSGLPSATDPHFGPSPVGYVAGRGRGMGDLARQQSDIGTGSGAATEGDADRADYSESNYDEFSGYGGSLFANYGTYDDDDREADEIYACVDDKMEARRKRARERQMFLEQHQTQQHSSLSTNKRGRVETSVNGSGGSNFLKGSRGKDFDSSMYLWWIDCVVS
jgi:pre-mRNA-processing factor 6